MLWLANFKQKKKVWSDSPYCTASWAVLFCSVLFCSVLFCSVLFCSVLFCSVLFCSVLFCSVLFCSVLFCSIPVWPVLLLGPLPLFPGLIFVFCPGLCLIPNLVCSNRAMFTSGWTELTILGGSEGRNYWFTTGKLFVWTYEGFGGVFFGGVVMKGITVSQRVSYLFECRIFGG